MPGQLKVGGGAGLAVQLGQRRLDDRVPVQAPLPAAELADQVVGQAHGDGEQPAVAGAPVHRHGRLDQVARAVHLVAPGQPGVPRLAADLEVGVQVAVGALRLLEQGGDLGGEGGELGTLSVGQFPADGLQRLVDVRVHEHRAAVAGPGQRIDRPDADRTVTARGSVAIGLAGRLAFGVRGSGRAAARIANRVVEVPASSSWRTASGRLAVRLRSCHWCSSPAAGRAGATGLGASRRRRRLGATALVTRPGGPAGRDCSSGGVGSGTPSAAVGLGRRGSGAGHDGGVRRWGLFTYAAP